MSVEIVRKTDLIRVALDEKRRLIERYRAVKELQDRANKEEFGEGGENGIFQRDFKK